MGKPRKQTIGGKEEGEKNRIEEKEEEDRLESTFISCLSGVSSFRIRAVMSTTSPPTCSNEMSQIDMFASQPETRECVENKGPDISSSCPTKLSDHKWLTFFEWDESVEKPFQIFSSTRFGSDIKPSWIQGTLSAKARVKRLLLEGKNLSLFGKMPSK